MTVSAGDPDSPLDRGEPAAALLAVDLGVRCGLAAYRRDGRLAWYRSHNFGSIARLKRGASAVLAVLPDLEHVVLEGDRDLATIWARAAERRGAAVRTVTPETWRKALLLLRERKSGQDAKESAGRLARAVIEWSGAKRPHALRHDAAEAILIGLWGVLAAGWLDAVPAELRRLV